MSSLKEMEAQVTSQVIKVSNKSPNHAVYS